MIEEQNVNTLKNVYQIRNQEKERAFEVWMNLMADNIRLESVADGARGMDFSRLCECKDDVLRYFEELASEWEMIHYTMEEYVAQNDRVVAIGRCGWRNRNTGKEVDTPKVDIIRMADGKIVDFYEIYDTAKALAAAQK